MASGSLTLSILNFQVCLKKVQIRQVNFFYKMVILLKIVERHTSIRTKILHINARYYPGSPRNGILNAFYSYPRSYTDIVRSCLQNLLGVSVPVYSNTSNKKRKLHHQQLNAMVEFVRIP